MDDAHAKATITYKGISAGGIFTFAENGEMISFATNDRWDIGTDGTKTRVPWSIVLKDYKTMGGIRRPTRFQVIWHYEKGDSVYFDSDNAVIEYH